MDGINVILADNPGLGRVRLCECNCIHFSIGPVTVSLAPQAFAQVSTLVRNAMEQLVEIAATQPPGCNFLQPEAPLRSGLTN